MIIGKNLKLYLDKAKQYLNKRQIEHRKLIHPRIRTNDEIPPVRTLCDFPLGIWRKQLLSVIYWQHIISSGTRQQQ